MPFYTIYGSDVPCYIQSVSSLAPNCTTHAGFQFCTLKQKCACAGQGKINQYVCWNKPLNSSRITDYYNVTDNFNDKMMTVQNQYLLNATDNIFKANELSAMGNSHKHYMKLTNGYFSIIHVSQDNEQYRVDRRNLKPNIILIINDLYNSTTSGIVHYNNIFVQDLYLNYLI